MFLIFMVSGGVTIQAILYPNYPLGKELIRRVITRPLFAMFLTQIDDLSGMLCIVFIHLSFVFGPYNFKLQTFL